MSLGAGLCLFSPKRPEDMVEAARSWGVEEHSSHLFQSMESRRTWGCRHSDTGDSPGKTVISFHRASCFHVQLLWHCICFCLMEKLLCKTPPEPDDNEYVSLFFFFCCMIYHAITRNCQLYTMLSDCLLFSHAYTLWKNMSLPLC